MHAAISDCQDVVYDLLRQGAALRRGAGSQSRRAPAGVKSRLSHRDKLCST